MMFKRLALAFAMVLSLAPAASAQITVPNTFTTRQVISSAKMNQNFDEVELKALNRTAPLLQATLVGDTTATYDIGSAAVKFRDAWFSRNASFGGTLGVTGAATFSSTVATGALTVTGTGNFSGLLTAQAGITVTGTVSATTLTGTLSTASQPNVTGLGTITAGTWNSNVITLAFGGTGTTLAATGGAGQFLKQASSGATITVVRPAIADLSDGTTIALLSAVNTFTGFGIHAWSAGNTGINQINVRNTAAGATNSGRIGATSDTVNTYLETTSSTYTPTGLYLAAASAIYGDGTGGLSLGAVAGALRFYTGTTQRWGINAAGDLTFGATPVIALSSGTPACSTACAGVLGNDFSMSISTLTSSHAAVIVTFGHTFTNTPNCIASFAQPPSGSALSHVNATTSAITINLVAASTNSDVFNVHCFGR